MSRKRKHLSRAEGLSLFDECQEAISSFEGTVRVNVSGGASSAISWKRCLDWWGPERVSAVFADTCTEDEDTYRFLSDCEESFDQRIRCLWTDKTTWEIKSGTLDSDRSNGASIWDVFNKHRISKVQSSGACKASVELKQKPLREDFPASGADVIALGYQSSEADRVNDFIEKHGRRVVFPLVASPSLGHCDVLRELDAIGINPPQVYGDGFEHNNCLQSGCILQGLKQWAGYLDVFPERFKETERESNKFAEETGFHLLKDRRGGAAKGMSLTQLREEVERGERFAGDWQSTCACMAQQELFPEETS